MRKQEDTFFISEDQLRQFREVNGYDYKAQFQREARVELDSAVLCYGATFQTKIEAWLSEIVQGAGQPDHDFINVDVLKLIEEVAGNSDADSLKLSKKRFWDGTFRTKLAAILTLLKKRCPPWEIRGASESVTVHPIRSRGAAVPAR